MKTDPAAVADVPATRTRADTHASRANQLLVWSCLALVPLLNWPATGLPFERDEGEYLLAATVSGHGEMPYRDVFLQKPPGIILVYRLLLGVTHGSAQLIHIAVLFIYVLTAIGIGAIARRLTDRPAVGAVAIALYALSLSTPLYQAQAANTETFMVAATVAAVYALLRARDSRSLAWIVVLGFALGVAGTMKQTAAPHAVWLLPTVAVISPTRSDKWRWPVLAGLIAMFVVVLVCIPYVLHGAGTQLFDAVVTHNFEYTGAKLERAYYQRIHVSLLDVATFHVALWLVAVIGAAMLAVKRRWWLLLVLGGWGASAWVGVSAGAFYRGHYFLQLLPPVAILAALTLVEAPRRIRIVGAPMLIVYWLMSNGFQWTADKSTLADQRYHTLFFDDAVLVGQWLAKQNDRSLYILGSEPEIYYYAHATPVTRYVIQNPLFGGFASSRKRQEETWAAVEESRPHWIVTVFPLEAIPFYAGSDAWLLNRLNAMLASGYVPRMAARRDSVSLVNIERLPDPSARQMTIWERTNLNPH